MRHSIFTIVTLALLGGADALGQESMRLRGRRLETRESQRQSDIVLEGVNDELHHRLSATGVEAELIDAENPRAVDLEELRERTLALYSGSTVQHFPEVIPNVPVRTDKAAPPQTAALGTTSSSSPVTRWSPWLAVLLLVALFVHTRRSGDRTAETS